MRLALISDIHGNLPALEAVAADIRRRGCDAVANLGDSLSGPLWPQETAQFLMAENWPTVAGNHERQLLTQSAAKQSLSDRFTSLQLGQPEWAWLAALPATLPLTEDILLCHGSPHGDRVYLMESIVNGRTVLSAEKEIRQRLGDTRAAVIACGHTHIPRSIHIDDMLLVNPGSVGLQAYEDDQPPHVVECGSPYARYAIIEKRQNTWTTEHFTVPYPHEAAVTKAQKEHRTDWAYALQYGRTPPAQTLPAGTLTVNPEYQP